MDQRSVESLLLRLVERVTESERHYTEALDTLHARLDRLAQTADAARGTVSNETETLERLHRQVDRLTRLDREPADKLDDFERLGRTLSEGLRAARSTSRTDFDFPPAAPAYSPLPAHESEDRDLNRSLIETAHRLERSIGTAMPAALDALNVRLGEIEQQIAQTLARAPTRENLQNVQRQLADMAQQLARAERQLAKIGGIEGQLLKLIARLDKPAEPKPAEPKPAPIDVAQLKEIAHKAAAEAAGRVVKEERQSTAARLDAMQRDLTAVSETTRQSNVELASKLQAVHESLKQLAQKVEQGAAAPPVKPRSAFVEPSRATDSAVPPTPKASTPGGKTASAEINGGQDTARKDTPETERPPSFSRIKRETGAFRRAKPEQTPEDALDTPEDLVAAARRGARAALLRGDRPATIISGETRFGRKRSLLIVAAAILLMLSAALLYERLRTRPRLDVVPPAAEQTVPPPAPDAAAPKPAPRTEKNAAPAANKIGEAIIELEHPSAWTPLPEESPADGAGSRLGDAGSSTDIAKSTHLVSAEPSDLSPEMQSPWLTQAGPAMLPKGVIFTLNGAGTGGQAKGASRTMPASLPLPPAELGPIALRRAAAEGNAKAQYLIALRYAEGNGVTRDLSEARAWFERAASAGLAPAQYRLGTLYEHGEGVTKDLGRARSWYAAAAEKGNVKAMHNLATGANGSGDDEADYETAANWHEEAAAYGFTDSQFNLGILYEHGLGRPQDLAEAYKWFALAALSGDAEAAKQRERLEHHLDAGQLTRAVKAVKAWQAKDLSPEANEVVEDAEWQTSVPNAALVNRAQALLNELGYDAGPPDGVFGARTRAAIEAFERRNGLEETGEVTIPLVTTLERLTG